jgi:hypothetical protein
VVGLLLVGPQDLHLDVVRRGEPRERREEPSREGVRIDRESQPGRLAGLVDPESSQRLRLEQADVPSEADHRLTLRGGPDRGAPDQQAAAQSVLEDADPLTHGRRGEVEAPRRRLQGPLVDHGRERAGQVRIDLHVKQC